jgi:hypothetical protein
MTGWLSCPTCGGTKYITQNGFRMHLCPRECWRNDGFVRATETPRQSHGGQPSPGRGVDSGKPVGAPLTSGQRRGADICPDCKHPWGEHDFGVPAPHCPKGMIP